MTAPVLTLSNKQTWLELRGVDIEDLSRRKAPDGPEILSRALGSGLAADPDPHRNGFYEASIAGYRYYFWIAPTGKVCLLARWQEN